MKKIKIDATGSDINADWIKKVGDYQMKDLAAYPASDAGTREKHLAGQHDQSSHGNWAKWRKAAGPVLNNKTRESIEGLSWFVNEMPQNSPSKGFNQDFLQFSKNRELGDALMNISAYSAVFDEGEIKRQKDEIVTRISEKAGVDYDEANQVIGNWAQSANDMHYASLIAQKYAAELMGQELSDWQAERLRIVAEGRQNQIDWNMSHPEVIKEFEGLENKRKEIRSDIERMENAAKYSKDPQDAQKINNQVSSLWSDYSDLGANMVQLRNQAPAGDLELNENSQSPFQDKYGRPKPGAKFRTEREAYRAIFKELYNWTQDKFRQAGIKELIVYRGVGFEDSLPLKVGDIADLTQNFMESWTLRFGVAGRFGQKRDNYAYILGMTIPVERIFCTARSGFGCLEEFEVVVYNGKSPDEVGVVYQRDPYTDYPVL
jgi:tellurite resistance protein